MKHFFFLSFVCCLSTLAFGQRLDTDSIASSFDMQMSIFPQEKIFIHTDKSYYLSGERIWFRTHLVEARTHQPALISKYVYVELINPLDSVVVRKKIRNEDNIYSGAISIPEDIAEGSYFLRAYTQFMQNAGTDYFELKNVYIASPQAIEVGINTTFEYESDKNGQINFHFFDPKEKQIFIPERVQLTIESGKQITLKENKDGEIKYKFNFPSKELKTVMLLEVLNENRLYQKYTHIPRAKQTYDLSFFPEGGYLVEGIANNVAFKALYSNGMPANIAGEIFDQENNSVSSFKTIHEGMGSFNLIPMKGKTYYAICKSEEGEESRFQIPTDKFSQYGLKVQPLKDRLSIAVQSNSEQTQPNDTLYLLAHTRGIVSLTRQWDWENEVLSIPNDLLEPGVLQILLLNKDLQPLGERLVFIDDHKKQRQAHITNSYNKSSYNSRELVISTIHLTDNQTNPLKGNFSVAVTDNKEIEVDSCTNSLITLLLTSDLKGYINNPAYYFSNNRLAAYSLDLLMLTQGWRRYDVPKIIQNDWTKPTNFIEISSEISGVVKSLILGKLMKEIDVTMMANNGEFLNTTQTDSAGCFYFYTDFPDSTRFIVNTISSKKLLRAELMVNEQKYPSPIGIPATLDPISPNWLSYIEKADKQYINENGMRMIFLDELVVRGERKPLKKSKYYSTADRTLTEDQIKTMSSSSMHALLMQAGAYVTGNEITLRPGGGTPLLVINDYPMDMDQINMITTSEVAQIDILTSGTNTSMFGPRGMNGIIAIHTKSGRTSFSPPPFHIAMISPLGYSAPVEFYAPKYDNPQTQASTTPDLRTTIHWQPSVQTDDNGTATFSFYTADAEGETSYSVIIEGITEDGKIIHQKETISVSSH